MFVHVRSMDPVRVVAEGRVREAYDPRSRILVGIVKGAGGSIVATV